MFRAVVHLDVDDAISDGLADFGPQQHWAHCLKDSGQDAGLPQGDHPRAHCRAKGVGHIIRPHRESQDEGYDEAYHQQPQVAWQIRLIGHSHHSGSTQRWYGRIHHYLQFNSITMLRLKPSYCDLTETYEVGLYVSINNFPPQIGLKNPLVQL